MTPEYAKNLGERALQLGMPFEDIDGLSDGAVQTYDEENARIGTYRLLGWGDGNDDARIKYHYKTNISWPDFRDKVTEAWLCQWAELYVMQYAADRHEEEPGFPDTDWWQITIGDIVVQGRTRAEAWIMSLESLRIEL